jgi:hypothetical protein
MYLWGIYLGFIRYVYTKITGVQEHRKEEVSLQSVCG